MWVKSLSVHDFRNFHTLEVPLNKGINIIHGDNAQGKTNLLEAVGICATGRSARALTDADMIRFGTPNAHVRAVYERNTTQTQADIFIQREQGNTKKYVSIDRVPITKWSDFLGRLMVVSFSPDDLQLIKSSPAVRRIFMDAEICQLNPVYYNDLREYNRALKQRNHLLKQLKRDEAESTEELSVWDEQLVKHGQRIYSTRTAFVSQMEAITQEIHASMTQGSEALSMTYKPNIENIDEYMAILQVNHKRDILQGSTSSGIHRDDILFEINDTPARIFGSQGQQRTVVLSVKLAEAVLVRQTAGDYPVLLLDDVLSELDKSRQQYLLKQIEPMQVLLTCTGVEDIIGKLTNDVKIMKMEEGQII
jgi:DNA replication and repair protein RecF